MDEKKRFWIIFCITLVVIMIPVAIGVALLPQMPDQIAIHFNAAGNPDSYASKNAAIWLLPVILLIVQCALAGMLFFSGFKKAKNDAEQKMLTSCLWLMPVLCSGASYILLGKAIGKNINVILAVVILLVVILSIIALSYIPVAKSKKQ